LEKGEKGQGKMSLYSLRRQWWFNKYFISRRKWGSKSMSHGRIWIILIKPSKFLVI